MSTLVALATADIVDISRIQHVTYKLTNLQVTLLKCCVFFLNFISRIIRLFCSGNTNPGNLMSYLIHYVLHLLYSMDSRRNLDPEA